MRLSRFPVENPFVCRLASVGERVGNSPWLAALSVDAVLLTVRKRLTDQIRTCYPRSFSRWKSFWQNELDQLDPGR